MIQVNFPIVRTMAFDIHVTDEFARNLNGYFLAMVNGIKNDEWLNRYAIFTEGKIYFENNKEFIGGSIIMDLDKSPVFIDSMQFRVSPANIEGRQKNWMPFVHDGKVYLIASVCPHIIYELSFYPNITCKQVHETPWNCPWPIQLGLRGNTNAVLLDDGNYLGTFHTSQYSGNICHYDNGCYIFEGKPPFKVLKCSNRTYLPADAAVHPHFRKANIIKCIFPVGMVREENRVLISYGDNDSIVKILDTTLDNLDKLMVEV